MEMKNNKYVFKILIATLSIMSYNGILKAIPYLMGVYNTTSSLGGVGRPRVQVGNSGSSISYSAWGPQVINEALPVQVSITYGSNINNGNPYVIEVKATGKAGSCQSNESVIEATLAGGNEKHQICLPNTITFGIPGAVHLRWQNVILAIADNPKYDSTQSGSLPFRFGVTSWTATNSPWNNKTITHPLNNDSITFNPALNVIQGNGAWGGSSLPRRTFGSIAHIYNNSPYIIMIARKENNSELAQSDFTQLVPPNSVEPFVMAWIPRVATSNVNSNDHSAIKFFAMYAKKSNSDANTTPPPAAGDFTPIGSVGSNDLAPTPDDISGIIGGIESHAPTLTEKLTGVKSISELISNQYHQYKVNNYYFSICTDDTSKNSYIQRCDFKTNSCTTIQTINSPAVNQYGVPNYFQLILDQDKQFGVVPNLVSIPSNYALVNWATNNN